jgi:hypothetical protein
MVILMFNKKRAYLTISPCNYIVYTKHQQLTGWAGNDDGICRNDYS